jgi:hypothetical protein
MPLKFNAPALSIERCGLPALEETPIGEIP